MTTPSIPRPSATILLVRDEPFEVLMIARHADQDFSSAMVFPGGIVDASDADDAWLPYLSGGQNLSREERALRISAFRETFEECGILLARTPDGSPLHEVSAEIQDFRQVVAQSGGTLPLDELVHFAHWITPEHNVRRYDTHFFIAAARPGLTACCDGNEAVEAIWISPDELLQQAASGHRKLVFPTRLNLRLLAQSGSTDEALASTRSRAVVTVLPRIEQREGEPAVVIPAEAGYDVDEEIRPSR